MKKILIENFAYLALVVFSHLLIHNEWRYTKNIKNLGVYYSNKFERVQIGHIYNVRGLDTLQKQIIQLDIEAAVLADEYRDIREYNKNQTKGEQK